MKNKLFLLDVQDFVDPHSMWLRINPDGLVFNSKMSQKLNLNNFSAVRFYADAEGKNFSKLYIEPNHDPKSKSNFRFTVDRTRLRTKNVSGRYAPCRNFVERYPRLKKIAQSQHSYQRRLQMEYDDLHKKYYAVVAPCFESSTNIDKSIPEIPCIYQLVRKNNQTVSLGETVNLKRRMKEHLSNSWDFYQIDFSIIEDEKERKQWESYHIDKFLNEHYQLPFYNRQRGKNFSDDISIKDHDPKTQTNGHDHFEEMLPVEGETEQ